MSRKSELYREHDEVTGELIKKECGICHKIKTADCFHKDKSKKDGFDYKCKQCESEKRRQRYKNNKDKECEKERQYRENHKEKISEKRRQRYKNNKDKECEKERQRRENRAQQEIDKIYEKVTKQRYPHKGVQYGIIYGVVCKVSNRWYIGQTETSFNIRYHRNFFKYKHDELSKDNVKRQLLAEDIEKYGIESFETIEVIDVAFSEEELDEKEAYYIDLYKAYDEGYNSNRGNIFKHGKEKRKCCCE